MQIYIYFDYKKISIYTYHPVGRQDRTASGNVAVERITVLPGGKFIVGEKS